MKTLYSLKVILICIVLLAILMNNYSSAQSVGISQSNFAPTSLFHVHSTAASGQLFQLSNASSTLSSGSPTVNSGFNISLDASKNITFNQYEDADFIFKLNNIQAGYLNHANSLTSFGYNAGLGNKGQYNTAIGTNAFVNNSSGSSNTIIGMDANYYFSTGSGNTAVGMYSLEGNSTPANNTGGYNTAIGYAAGSGFHAGSPNNYQITTGDHNTFIGYASSANATGYTNATALGSYSLAGASNSLVLGSINGINDAPTSTNVGIGIIAPTSLLHIVDGGTTPGFATGNLVTIDGNKTTTGKTLYIPSSTLTSGNLLHLNASNTAATGSALLVENDGASANAIQAIGGGNPNYSAIFATATAAAGGGSAYDVTHSCHTIYGTIDGGQPYSFGIYGNVNGSANNSAGVMGHYATNCYGMLGYYNSANTSLYGVYGLGGDGSNGGAGVFGVTSGGNAGVSGKNTSGNTVGATGVFGINSTYGVGALGYYTAATGGIGVYGLAGSGLASNGAYAGYFSGNVALGGTASASQLQFFEPSGGGANYTAFQAQAQAGNVTYTLPAADGNNRQALTTNGAGTMSWQTLYGSNVQSVVGTTDISINSTTPADVANLSITFTPVHNTVYVSFGISGATAANLNKETFVCAQLYNNGVMVAGTGSIASDFDDVTGVASAYNVFMNMYPVTVTAGSSTTIKVQWYRGGTSPDIIYNNCNTHAAYSHRSMTIWD